MMNQLSYKHTYVKNLPHIQPPGATLFVTYRLAGSLPASVIQRLMEEADKIENALLRIEDLKERTKQAYLALSRIMHSLKRHTALKANKILERRGKFWQHESYDHVVRDEAELKRIRQYVLNNPVKAGLVAEFQDWPWSYCKHL